MDKTNFTEVNWPDSAWRDIDSAASKEMVVRIAQNVLHRHKISSNAINASECFRDRQIGTMQRVIVLQYNPDSLTRTLQARTVGGWV